MRKAVQPMKKKNKIRLFSALLLIMTLILGVMNPGVNNDISSAEGTVYGDWLSLEGLLESEGVPSKSRSAQGKSSDLTDFLDSVDIVGAEKNEEGKYVIIEGVPYTIQMNFSEKVNSVQFDETNSLIYRFPDGFTPNPSSGTVEMTGNAGVVRFNYVISGDTLTVTFDETSPGYSSFITSENAQFEIHATGVISKEVIEFSSEVSGEFDLDDSREVSVRKVGEYDAALNKIKFTVWAYSDGNNTNVHIGDIIEGTALNYDPGSLTVTSSVSNLMKTCAPARHLA